MATKASKPIVLLILLAITLCGSIGKTAMAAPNQNYENDHNWEYEESPLCPLDDDELYEGILRFDDVAATSSQVPRTLTFNAGANATWTSVPTGWSRNAAQTQLTRTVNAGTPWSAISWPTVSNVSRQNHAPTIPIRPTGTVPATGGTVTWTVAWTPTIVNLTFNGNGGAPTLSILRKTTQYDYRHAAYSANPGYHSCFSKQEAFRRLV